MLQAFHTEHRLLPRVTGKHLWVALISLSLCIAEQEKQPLCAAFVQKGNKESGDICYAILKPLCIWLN